MSRLVLGTARLHHLPSPSSRSRLLHEALACGLRAFDVAPAYGNGLSEVELGRALQGMRASAAIHTKVGIPIRIYPTLAGYGFPLYRLLDIMGGSHARSYRSRDFTAKTILDSVEHSLRRLRTDYVDTLFLHEPLQPLLPAEVEEIRGCVARLKQEGKVRAFGVAGPVRAWNGPQGWGPDAVIQCPLADLQLPEVRTAAADAPMIFYATHRAFCEQRAGASRSFASFLTDRMAGVPGARFIVATTSVYTLRKMLA